MDQARQGTAAATGLPLECFYINKLFLSSSASHFIPSPQVSFDSCSDGASKHYSCSVFADRRPRTVSMTVLVIVEMFNALNNLSENQSLL